MRDFSTNKLLESLSSRQSPILQVITFFMNLGMQFFNYYLERPIPRTALHESLTKKTLWKKNETGYHRST